MSRSWSIASFVFACGLAHAQAQCPDWSPGVFAQPGLDDNLYAQVSFDDGSGPALYLASNTMYDGVGLAGVTRWDGASLQPLRGATVNPYSAYSLAVFDSGSGPSLYAGGLFSGPGPQFFGVARWNGSDWIPLGTPGNGNVVALAAFDEDGNGPAPASLYAAGTFTSISGTAANHIARWTGSAWVAVGAGIEGSSFALCVFDSDGSGPAPALLYATVNNSVARLKAWDGTSWSTVNAPVDGRIDALISFDEDGAGPLTPRLYVGGQFTAGCAMFDGTVWTNAGFTPATEHEVYAFAIHDEDGAGPLLPALFAGGEIEAGAIEGVARRTGSTWTAVGAGIDGKVFSLGSLQGHNGPRLAAGGYFSNSGATRAQNVAQWNGAAWSALKPGNGLSAQIGALCTYDDGTGTALYAGGVFEFAGPVETGSIARWDGTSWSAVGVGAVGGVDALCVFDDGSGASLIVGGGLSSAGGVPVNNIARWNGTDWFAMGAGLSGEVNSLAIFDSGSGPRLYAGGRFPGGIARWDGTTWSLVGGGTSGSVFALAVHDEGDGLGPALFVGGSFTLIGGVPANRIARWRSGGFSALGVGTSNSVETLCSFTTPGGPILVVGGTFQLAGGTPPSHLTSWSNGGWHSIVNGVAGPNAFQPAVTTTFVHDDGSGGGAALYVGGNFTAMGNVPTLNLARWDGTTWTAVAGGVFGDVHAMASFDDGIGAGAALYVGGFLSQAGNTAAVDLARLSNCGSTGNVVCAGDGSGAACPCGNTSPAGSQAGCASSLGVGGRLTASGFASLGADSLVLSGTQMPNAAALYFQGSSAAGAGAGVPFGDGLRCAGGDVRRLGVHINAQGASVHPEAGGAPVSVQGGVASPGTRIYQVWYRNPASFCTPSTFNLTNGLRVLWVQ